MKDDPWDLVQGGSYNAHRTSRTKWVLPPGVSPYIRHTPNPMLGGTMDEPEKSHKIHDAWEAFKHGMDEFLNGPHAPAKPVRKPRAKKATFKKAAKKKARKPRA